MAPRSVTQPTPSPLKILWETWQAAPGYWGGGGGGGGSDGVCSAFVWMDSCL